jgi:LPXTG-motif cell wall-anchored protein
MVHLHRDSDGIPGVSAGDAHVATSSPTLADGKYQFTNLPAGDYYVVIPGGQGALTGLTSSDRGEEANPNSDGDNNDNGTVTANVPHGAGSLASAIVTVGPAEPTNEVLRSTSTTDDDSDNRSNFSVDFGFYRLVSLGDTVWIDTDRNGIQDAGEPGMDGVFVELLDEAGVPIPGRTTTTGTIASIAGQYGFIGLQPGTYRVRFTLPTGYEWTGSAAGSDRSDDSDPSYTTATDATATTGPITIGTTVVDTNGNPHALTDPTIDAGVHLPVPPIVSTGTVDLKLVKTLTGATPKPGGTAEWLLTVANIGTATAIGPITIEDELVNTLTYQSSTGEGWRCEATGQTVRCTYTGDIAPNVEISSLHILTSVSKTAIGKITNAATVLGTSVETMTINNESAATISVVKLPVTGSDTKNLTTIAAAVLALGLALTLVARRRKRLDPIS